MRKPLFCPELEFGPLSRLDSFFGLMPRINRVDVVSDVYTPRVYIPNLTGKKLTLPPFYNLAHESKIKFTFASAFKTRNSPPNSIHSFFSNQAYGMIRQKSTYNMFSIKLLISASVLSAALMVTSIADIAVYVPWIYNGVVSWLRPPYLYLLLNCIIITIVAFSKLQTETDDVPSNAVSSDVQIVQTEYTYRGVEKKLEFEEDVDAQGRIRNEDSPLQIVRSDGGADDATSNKENECLGASAWSATDVTNYVPSARFSHRRNSKASPQGGRTVLGVSKPKKQDTLENTWKAITEGRSIPMSRHLKKSDTWERQQAAPLKKGMVMKKAETFNDRSTTTTTTKSGKLRKEVSLSQDELNRRVEAFINKFNQEMRLQRQESLNHYAEIVNRASH